MDIVKHNYKFIYKSKNKNFFLTFYLMLKLFIFRKKSFLDKKYNVIYKKQFKFDDVEEGSFSQDWFSYNKKYLVRIFYKFNLINRSLNILEIGSFEGKSTLFFLKIFNNSKITCVDTFEPSEENLDKDFNIVYDNFKKNIKPYKDRVNIFKGTSDNFFKKNNQESYDLIYVDGNHKYDFVLRDANNSFKKLKRGGIMVFDDFMWNYYDDINQNPIGAIKEFIKDNFFQIKIISISYQLALIKI